MVRVEIKGLAKVRSKGKTYWYAWRGGPRLTGEPGTPAFMASYQRALEEQRTPDQDRFHSVIVSYKSSNAYKTLAPSTRAEWGKWLDRIGSQFGDLRTKQFDRPDKIRPIIVRWRNAWAETPRTADYAMQVLSRVCAYAVDPLGKIAGNPCEGIKHLYANDRADIIWTDSDVANIKKTCSGEIADAIDLAGHSGLRLGDLVRVAWSHIDEDIGAIVLTTGKSRQRREAVIPLYPALRDVLARIPKRATTILSNSRRRPWTPDGFGSSFNKAKIDAGIADKDLHFNDLRGTAATKFYIAGFTMREIAETLAWEEESVEKIIRRYVERGAAIKARIAKLKAK